MLLGSGMNYKALISLVMVLSTLLVPLSSWGQKTKKIIVKQVESWEYDESLGINAQRLIGSVIFEHDGALMSCDSAYLYNNDKSVEAFGRVHINQGDTVHLYGDSLRYDAGDKTARLRQNIRMIDKDMQLTTNIMNYDLKTSIGSYFNGGTIISQQNQNKLTSKEGYYHSESKTLHFKDSVVLHNPEYDMYCDTLHYNTVSEVSWFFGPTLIRSKDNLIYCENGWYDTKNNVSSFEENAYIITEEHQKLEGDSMYYDRNKGIGEVFDNITITDTVNDFLVNGHYAIHYEQRDLSIITKEAMLTQIYKEDSLFLHSDTLKITVDTTTGDQVVHAYYRVKFYRHDMQGKCDSLVYSESDSTLRMYHTPVLWSEENQLDGEFIEIVAHEGKINQLIMYNSAFMISEEDSLSYNQIKGKKITGYFKDNDLVKIHVEGNGETIYHPVDEKDTGEKEKIGIYKAECSDLYIHLEDNELKGISFITQPSGILHPEDEVAQEEQFLKGFHWEFHHRPLTKADIFKWVE